MQFDGNIEYSLYVFVLLNFEFFMFGHDIDTFLMFINYSIPV
jgi:hypothetical protein